MKETGRGSKKRWIILGGAAAPEEEEIAAETPDTATHTPQPTLTGPVTARATAVPTATPTQTRRPTDDPPSQDTTPPLIYGAVINPKVIFIDAPGCPGNPRTAESVVVAVDNSGIKGVYGK